MEERWKWRWCGMSALLYFVCVVVVVFGEENKSVQ